MEEIFKARRENTLTIRFLAQTLINDCLFPDQRGIKKLLSKSINCHGNELSISDDKFHYSFLFHLEDFMKYENKDKSEIDLMIVQNKTLYLIEIKAFSDANSLGVKRELVRNYLRIKEIKNNKEYFQSIENIIPILLYSDSFQESLRKKHDFNYFNESFLLKKGNRQKRKIENSDWQKGSYRINNSLIKNLQSLNKEVVQINQDLFFLTWNDVLNSCKELNEEKNLSSSILEMVKKEDSFNKRSKYPIKLVKN